MAFSGVAAGSKFVGFDDMVSILLEGCLRYDSAMKTPPNNPEFNRFTDAMKTILKVSKTEMVQRIEAEKATKRTESPAASR